METKYAKIFKKKSVVNQKLGWWVSMMKKVEDHWKIGYGNHIVKMQDDRVLQDEVKKPITMPLHQGAFVLGIGKRNMNNFFHAFGGFYTNDVSYVDTDSLYFENKHWAN